MVLATEVLETGEADASEQHHIADARLGQVIAGSYRITRHIGSGGSSHVFAAEHVRLGKPFAVKLLRPELDRTKQTAQRFRREAQAVAKLQNEHIVSVVDCGELEDRTPYLVTELLEGQDLRSLLERTGPLTVKRATQIVIEACRGLSAAHDAGLIHRDLKPENLFITRRSTGEEWCKVLDFGVAKMESSLVTARDAIVGTVRYMSPEQLADSASVGPTTDIYALGAILYECLAGKPPHAGGTIQELMFSIMNREPVSLSALSPTLPGRLVAIVTSCLDKQSSMRPQRAEQLAELLAAPLERADRLGVSEGTLAEDSGHVRRPSSAPGTPPTPFLVAAALLLAGLAGASVSWLIKPNPVRDLPTAKTPAAAEIRTAEVTTVARDAAPAVSSAPPSTAEQAPSAARTSTSPRGAHSPQHPAAAHTAREATTPLTVPAGNLDQANPYSD